MQARRSSRAT